MRPWRPRTGHRCHRCAPAHRWHRSGLQRSLRPIRQPPRRKPRCWQPILPCWKQWCCLRHRRSRSVHRRRGPERSERPLLCGWCVFSFLFVPFLFLNMIFAEQKVQERVPGKTKGAFLLAGRQSKKALFSFFRLFGYNQFLVIWGLRPRTNSGQVSWLKAQHPPPPSRNMRSSDRCSCTLAVNSLITVTRSCGICTRFPFNVPAPGQSRGRYAPAVFYSVRCSV